MIRLYQEHYCGAMDTKHGRRLILKGTWNKTNAQNLDHAVSEMWRLAGNAPVWVEIDGVMVSADELPSEPTFDEPRDGRQTLIEYDRLIKQMLRKKEQMEHSPVFGL